jgi:lipoate-protein ligase A
LASALGRGVSYEECVAALGQGFARALNLTLAPGALTDDESAAMELLREKHRKREWLFDRERRARQTDQVG